MNNKINLDMWTYQFRFAAGMVNALAFLKFSTIIATITGIIVDGSVALVESNWLSLLECLGLALAFIVGSIISGMVFPRKKYILKKRYPMVLFIIAVFILFLESFGLPRLIYLYGLIFIIGLQNGMNVYHNDSIVRTTMVTGNLTEIGLALGRLFNKEETNLDTLYFNIKSISSFVIGTLFAIIIEFITPISLAYATVLTYLFTSAYCAIDLKRKAKLFEEIKNEELK